MTHTHLKAVVLDWAGTVVDHGSLAPMGVFQRSFAHFGVEISVDEARGPMGMAKRDHIKAVMMLPRVAAAWVSSQALKACTSGRCPLRGPTSIQ